MNNKARSLETHPFIYPPLIHVPSFYLHHHHHHPRLVIFIIAIMLVLLRDGTPMSAQFVISKCRREEGGGS